MGSHKESEYTHTSDEGSEIQPRLNQMQQSLHCSIVIRNITRIHLEKWGRLLKKGPKRLTATMQLRELLHHMRVENQQLLDIAENLLEKGVW